MLWVTVYTLEECEMETPAVNSEEEEGDMAGDSNHAMSRDLFETLQECSHSCQASASEPADERESSGKCVHTTFLAMFYLPLILPYLLPTISRWRLAHYQV